jgi:hypothetical protein
MFNATGRSQNLTCQRCRRPASLRLHATLPEADGFPEVQCLECWACGEVVIIERGLGEEPLPIQFEPDPSAPSWLRQVYMTTRNRAAERGAAGVSR